MCGLHACALTIGTCMHADAGKEALGVHSCYVLGQMLDSEKNRIAIVLSTQNLLLNAYRLTRNGTV
jgi:hypothetical protein